MEDKNTPQGVKSTAELREGAAKGGFFPEGWRELTRYREPRRLGDESASRPIDMKRYSTPPPSQPRRSLANVQRVERKTLSGLSKTNQKRDWSGAFKSSGKSDSDEDVKLIIDWRSEAAQALLAKKRESNREFLMKSQLKYPWYKVVCGKYAGVVCKPFLKRGEERVNVVLEKYPDPKGSSTGLFMTLYEWYQVSDFFDELQEYVNCFHGLDNSYSGLKDKRTGKPLNLVDICLCHNIHLNVKPGTSAGKFLTIDFRRIDWVDGERKPLLSGISLSSGGFSYLNQILRWQIKEGIKMWLYSGSAAAIKSAASEFLFEGEDDNDGSEPEESEVEEERPSKIKKTLVETDEGSSSSVSDGFEAPFTQKV